MRKLKGLLFLLLVTMTLSIPAAAATVIDLPITVTVRNDVTGEFIAYLNQQREALGRDPYIIDSKLMELARQRATDICVMFGHKSTLITGEHRIDEYIASIYPTWNPASELVGEDVAVGVANASGVYKVWDGSTTHKPVLVASTYKYCGAAAVDYNNTRYWVLVATTFPLGNAVPVSNVKGDGAWSTTVPTSLDYFIANSRISFVFYGTTSNIGLGIRNRGDNTGVAGGYVFQDTSQFSATANNPEIFTISKDGIVTPKKVGTGTVSLSVAGKNIGDVSVTVKAQGGILSENGVDRSLKAVFPKSSYDWTGSAICPKPTIVTDWYDNKLVEGVDYKIEYTNNINPTTSALAKVVGINNYNGSSFNSLTFSIVKKETSSGSGTSGSSTGNAGGNTSPGAGSSGSSSNTGNTTARSSGTSPTGSTNTDTGNETATPAKTEFTVKPAKKNYTYTGKAVKAKLAVYANGKKLSAKNYAVKYKNNKGTGIATIVVTGKGNYAAWKGTGTFNILPKKTSFSKVQSKKAGTAVLKWKKLKQVNGYEIQFSTDKKFRTFNTVKTGKVSVTLKKLTSKRIYYVRVRGYRNVKGGRIYGAWSKAKKVKTK